MVEEYLAQYTPLAAWLGVLGVLLISLTQHVLQPVVPQGQVYDDAYESLDLPVEGWKGIGSMLLARELVDSWTFERARGLDRIFALNFSGHFSIHP